MELRNQNKGNTMKQNWGKQYMLREFPYLVTSKIMLSDVY